MITTKGRKMKNKEKFIDKFPNHKDYLLKQLREDEEYAEMWFESILEDYSKTKDVNELVYNLRPLIEAKYTLCEFAKKVGVHRITLYKIFAKKMVPSIDILNKVFSGIGYNLNLSAVKEVG